MENELVLIEEGKALEFFTAGGLEPFLAEVEKMVECFDHDMTTKKGRDATRSFARKIATFKGKVEDSGKELVADWKTKAKSVDVSRKHSRDTLDTLRDKARQPLTDWENAEEARKAAHVANLETLKELVINELEDSATYAANLKTAKETPMGECWEEYAAGAAKHKDDVIAFLEGALAKALELEAEQAELERLRVAEEARKQKERDDAIAKEAADKARAEEAQKAKDLAAKVEADRVEGIRREEAAKEQAAQAERDRIASEERAKLEQAAAAKRAIEEAARAEVERELAVKRAKEDAEVAQRAKKMEEKAAQDKLEANKRYTNKIEKQARASFVAAGFTEAEANGIVAAIIHGIANVSINY